MNAQIKIRTADEEIFLVNLDIIRVCGTVKTMLEDLGFDARDEEVIPLPNVNAPIFRKVLQWATHHKDDPALDENVEDKERTDDISSWDANFLHVDMETLFDLILAANYLDIRGLLNVACMTVANMIKGKTPEEIRNHFGIPNDFTPVEEEQIRKENSWCEEK